MRVTHTFHLVCRCPVNSEPDVYQVEVEVDRLLPCENLLAVAEEWKGETAFQEEVTRALANVFKAKVTTRGTHCGGRVQTVCACEPETTEPQ